MKTWCFTLLLASNAFCLVAQAQAVDKNVTYQDLVWFGYFNRAELSSKVMLVSELQERHYIEGFKRHQRLIRAQVQYRIHPEWNVSVGLTYFLQSAQDPASTSDLVVPEIRPHIQLSGDVKLSDKLRMNHRMKLESRYFRNVDDGELADGFEHWYRARYRLGLAYTIARINDRPLKLLASDEFMINFGELITYNRFDQNRYYFGFSIEITDQFTFEAGYMNWFQQRASGVDFYDRDILRLNVHHRINLKSKQPSNDS